MVSLGNLNKQNIYIISVLPFASKKTKNYTWIIKTITKYLNQINHSKIQEITTHNAWLFYHYNKWILCEVSFNGRVHREFVLNNKNKYYITHINIDINKADEVKYQLMEKYWKKDVNTLFTKIIATIFNYPIFKAIGSVEFPNNKIYYYLLNKLTDFISDIAKSTRRLLNMQSEFCTEAVMQDLFELYITKSIDYLPVKLINKIIDVKFKFDELYPQNILELTQYEELVD